MRPRAGAARALSDAPKIVLYSMRDRARLIAFDLQEMTDNRSPSPAGGNGAEGRPIEPTPADAASQDDRIDFLFGHDRHLSNDQAARDYLAWEEQLPAQIEADGDATYNIVTS